MKTLMDHQKKALEYATPLTRIALYMEMRLGKTLVAIRWVKSNSNSISNILVLAPKSVLPAWESELLEEKQNVQRPTGTLEERFKKINESKKGWTLLNYEAVTLYPDFLSFDWDCIICDESTYIRNPKANITKLLNKFTYRVRYKAILSGLPAPESPKDYYCQFQFLYGNFMYHTQYWTWRNHYCMQIGYDWDIKKSFIPKIKEEVHRLAFVLTRKEAGLGSKKIYEQRYVELNNPQKKLINKIDKDFEYRLGNEEDYTKYSPVKYIWMARVSGGFSPSGKENISTSKIEELRKLLVGELKEDKVIIWFRFNTELEFVRKELQAYLHKKDQKIGIFTADKKEGIEKDMRLSQETKVMCAQSRLGKMGLPWYDSSAMIFYSNWYDYEVRAQCEDRGIHPMKKEPYLIIDLISEDSIDEDTVELLKNKKLSAKYFMKELESKWERRKKK